MDVLLPNGRLITGVPEGTSKEAVRDKAIKSGIAKPEDFQESGILSSAVSGAKSLASSSLTAAKSLLGSSEEAATEGLERQKAIQEQYAPGTDPEAVRRAYEESGLLGAGKEVVSQIPTAIAETAPALVTMALGALAGSPLGPIGAIGGSLLSILPSQYGSNIEQQAAVQQAEGKPVDIQEGRALAAAAAQSGLDVASAAVPFGKVLVGKLLGKQFGQVLETGTKAERIALERAAQQALTKAGAKGIALTAAAEVPTEVVQQMIGRAQAGQELFSDEALSEYGQAAYAAGLMSPIGAIGGISDRQGARRALDERTALLDNALNALRTENKSPTPIGIQKALKDLNLSLDEAKNIHGMLVERGDIAKRGRKFEFAQPTTTETPATEPAAPATEEAPAAEAPAAEAQPEAARPAFGDLLGEITEDVPVEQAEEKAAPEVAEVAEAVQEESQVNLLDQALAKLREGTIAPNPVGIKNILGGTLTEARDIHRQLVERGDIIKPVKPGQGYQLAPIELPEQVPVTEKKRGKGTRRKGVAVPVEPGAEVGAGTAGTIDTGVGGIGEGVAGGVPAEGRGDVALAEVPTVEAPVAEAPVVKENVPYQFKGQGDLRPRAQAAPVPQEEIPGAKPPSGTMMIESTVQPRPAEGPRALDITEEPPAPPARSEGAVDALRKGDLGRALYVLTTEAGGETRGARTGMTGVIQGQMSPLRWLADRLFNVVERRDDRSAIIKAEQTRAAREKGLQEGDRDYAKLMQDVEDRINMDFDLKKSDLGEEASGLAKKFKPKYERMVPLPKGSTIERTRGRMISLGKPLSAGKKGEQVPVTWGKRAFGGAGIHVEGTAKGPHQAVIERLKKEGKVAEYNPRSNTFYFTEEGLTDITILHEMVHAATVKVLRDYAAGRQVTKEQGEAAEVLYKIFDATKNQIGKDYPKVYENIYEFVSYAMTDAAFQARLAEVRIPALSEVFFARARTAWSAFTLAVARMFGLDKYAQTQRPLSTRVKSAGSLDNVLLQTIELTDKILTVPKAGMDVDPLAARRKAQPSRIQAPPARMRSVEEIAADNARPYKQMREKTAFVEHIRRIFTNTGWEETVRDFQNYARPLLRHDENLRRAGKLKLSGPDANAIHDLLTTSSTKADEYVKESVEPAVRKLSNTVAAFAKADNLSVDEATDLLGTMSVARHEQERRYQKFLENVPLDNQTKLRVGTQTMTPATYREAIMQAKNSSPDKATAESLQKQLRTLVSRYAKEGGDSPTVKAKSGPEYLDQNHPAYDVVGGFKAGEVATVLDSIKNSPHQAELNAYFKAIEELNEVVIELDRKANYWNPAVDGVRWFYGYKNYVPYKGMIKSGTKVGSQDLKYELSNVEPLGSAFTQLPMKALGRRTSTENPIYQLMLDAHLAAGRASRVGITDAIENQIKQGHLTGKAHKPIPFADREKIEKELLDKRNKLVTYLPDGSVQILEIKNPGIVESIRGLSSDLHWGFRAMNSITQFIGRQHTFYNLGFHPGNFVRDFLTNAWNMGAELGPKTAARFIANISAKVATLGLARAGKVAYYYHKGDTAKIKSMAAKNPFVNDIYEFISMGGRSAYSNSLSIAGQIETQMEQIGAGKLGRAKMKIDEVFSTWADMFEFTSRAAAYAVVRDELMARARDDGQNLNDPAVRSALKQEAVAYTKNLFNYEQVGRFGRQLGSVFIFLRPSVTSAVRAVDALLPAFQRPENLLPLLPPSLQGDSPQAEAGRQAFLADHARRAKNAKIMMGFLTGVGVASYLIALSMAGQDEEGRNIVENDDMAMWVRNLRLPVKFAGERNDFLQIPWGFGIGAFGALGAQLGALLTGQNSLLDVIKNAIPIGLDSFLPLPVPRYSPLEHPGEFVLSTAMPSVGRPVLEFMMGLDALGREINISKENKYGAAYTGGDFTPELYHEIAQAVVEFGNEIGVPVDPNKMSPENINFIVSSYGDAIGKMAHELHGLGLTMTGRKDFDAKKDLIALDMFIGKRIEVDPREYYDVKKKIDKHRAILNAFKNQNNFDAYDLYTRRNPDAELAVEIFDQIAGSDLRDIQAEMRALQADKSLSPKEKAPDMRYLRQERNAIMKTSVDSMKELGIEP